jgi:hypothetical protein
LRGLSSDGSIGLQTVVPPSIHETGETVGSKRALMAYRRISTRACLCLQFVRWRPPHFSRATGQLRDRCFMHSSFLPDSYAKDTCTSRDETSWLVPTGEAAVASCIHNMPTNMKAGGANTGFTNYERDQAESRRADYSVRYQSIIRSRYHATILNAKQRSRRQTGPRMGGPTRRKEIGQTMNLPIGPRLMHSMKR